jgi:dihydroxy-acid dehydratase
MKILLAHDQLHVRRSRSPEDHRGNTERCACGTAESQNVIRSWENALYPEGHLVILKGNLATEGAVAKITGVRNRKDLRRRGSRLRGDLPENTLRTNRAGTLS